MPNAAQFFQAARCRPPVVLRRQLSEFTLGHYLYLSEADSPFLPESTPREAEPLDLFLAVHICSGPVAVRQRQLNQARRFQWWVLSCFRHNFRTEVAHFSDYIANAFKAPDFSVGDGKTKPLNTPHVCSLFGVMMEKFHQPYSEVENMPLDKARWLQAVYLDHHSTLRLWDDRREELWQAVQEMERTAGRG